MRRSIVIVLLHTHFIFCPPRLETQQTPSRWNIFQRMLTALTYLFPYANSQALVINENQEERVSHSTIRRYPAQNESH